MAQFFFGFDPECFLRAHGIGARITCGHPGADPSGFSYGYIYIYIYIYICIYF